MVDIHCHILPGIDDGATSWEVAAQMCRMARADGIDHIVATPHANDEYSYDRRRHSESLARLQQIVGPEPALTLGCDFHFSYQNVQDALARPDEYAINGGYLLVELSDFAITPALGEQFSRLRASDLIPVLTHPERNMLLQRKPEAVLHLIEYGCVVQVTAGALTGNFGPGAKRAAEWLLEHEAVHVLATDAHNLKGRPPLLSPGREAAARIAGPEIATALVEDNPRAIVTGQPLPYYPNPLNA